ncbi:MAG: site-specific integrase [Kineosporiaceae bacterium]|nr:site-specific integrase [Aeromicrobium sp.]
MSTTESYTLKKSGKTRYRVRYRTVDNRPTVKSSFETKEEAAAWAATHLLAKRNGTATSPARRKLLVGSFVQLHVNRTVGLSPSTIANRQSIAGTWVLPDWANKTVGNAEKDGTADVNRWIEKIARENAQPDTIQKAHGILLASLQLAVGSRAIAVNPATGATLPKIVKRLHEYLTHEEVAELGAAIDPRWKTLIAVLAYCGLRFGELSALRAGQVDLVTRRIHIVRSVTSVAGHMVEGLPKFHKLRKVYFPAFLDDAMASQLEGKGRADLVFAAPRGGFVRLDDWRRRAFNQAKVELNSDRAKRAKATGLFVEPFPAITPHDLRHTAASLSVSAGANIKAIQIMLGHASAAMTLDVYADLFDNDEESVAIALNGQAIGQISPSFWTPAS